MGTQSDQPDVTPVSTEAAEPDTLLTGEQTQEADDDSTDDSTAAGNTDDVNTGDSDDEAGDDTGEGNNDEPQDFEAFNLPDGMEMNTELLSEVTPIFKEAGLTQEQAQKFIDIHSQQLLAQEQGKLDAFNQLNQEWRDAVKNDKDIGGDNYDQSIANARTALNKFGTPELTKLLNETGIGNNPEVVRFMNSVGALLQEDQPGGPSGTVKTVKDRADVLYPTSS